MVGQVEPVALVTVIVAVVACLATGYAYFRSSAVKVWEQNSDAYRARVELLEQQNAELTTKLAWMEQRIHELEARPNYDQVAAIIRASELNIIDAVKRLRDEVVSYPYPPEELRGT